MEFFLELRDTDSLRIAKDQIFHLLELGFGDALCHLRGTTGGGKSTTVANLVAQLQAAGAAVVLLDTEGEYTEMDQPTDDPTMEGILQELGRQPAGVPETHLYFLVGRQCANPLHPRRQPFSPEFSTI
ncbi:MAG: helicase HerA domain-containing protein, partial [Acidimicrobiales bacterium]